MKSNMNSEDSPEERLRTLVKKAGQVLKQNEDFYKFCLVFLSQGVRDADIRKIMTDFYRDSVKTFKELIEEGISSGDFKKIKADKAARAIYFLVMGVYPTYFSVDPDFDIEEQHYFHIESMISFLKIKKKA